ncbi:excinuclease ABC subunit C [Campylobacter ureolyticus]|nr:excinuclease ABC subunit C [Campylobacter ureolyticus]
MNFINKHYLMLFLQNQPVAVSKIYVNDDFLDIDLVSEILEARHSKKFEIIVPKIGKKRKICNIAHQNAKINIQKHLKAYDFEFLNSMKEYFGFTNLPINIEAYDNSHMFGSAVVGAMNSL